MEKISMPSPAEIALPVAEELIVQGHLDAFEHTDYEARELAKLEKIAVDLQMVDRKYFVTSGRSFLVPVSFEADEETEVVPFADLTFAGEFVTYSTLKIGRLIGRNAVRSLCLTFNNVTLLPYFDEVPHDQLLHVPAFAVVDMDKMAA